MRVLSLCIKEVAVKGKTIRISPPLCPIKAEYPPPIGGLSFPLSPGKEKTNKKYPEDPVNPV